MVKKQEAGNAKLEQQIRDEIESEKRDQRQAWSASMRSLYKSKQQIDEEDKAADEAELAKRFAERSHPDAVGARKAQAGDKAALRERLSAEEYTALVQEEKAHRRNAALVEAGVLRNAMAMKLPKKADHDAAVASKAGSPVLREAAQQARARHAAISGDAEKREELRRQDASAAGGLRGPIRSVSRGVAGVTKGRDRMAAEARAEEQALGERVLAAEREAQAQRCEAARAKGTKVVGTALDRDF